MLSINTNTISLAVQRSFGNSTNKMNETMKKMTTGFKINSAADDAAGYGVVKEMESKLNTYSVAETNGQMGSSLLQTQEGVLEIIGSYLQRIRDLAEQAANGTYATSSRIAIATEVSQRMQEMNRLCDSTDFNGLKLLDGSQIDGVNLQVGINSGDENVITLDKSLFASCKVSAIMGLNATTNGAQLTGANDTKDEANGFIYSAKDSTGANEKWFKSAMIAQLYTVGMADATGKMINGQMNDIEKFAKAVFANDNSSRAFLDTVDLAVNNISQRATQIGAYMNRVDSAVESLTVQSDNLTEAKSLIKDADIAKISSEYLSYQILQQAGATMLTTANQTPSIALNLI